MKKLGLLSCFFIGVYGCGENNSLNKNDTETENIRYEIQLMVGGICNLVGIQGDMEIVLGRYNIKNGSGYIRSVSNVSNNISMELFREKCLLLIEH